MARIISVPPPLISPSSKISGGNTGPFPTNFPSAQNPLSQSGYWVQGKDVGVLWNNTQVQAAGQAIGTANMPPDPPAGSARYADNICHVDPTKISYSGNQFAEGHIWKSGSFANVGAAECELLFRFEITTNNARGYELLWGNGANHYIALVRWNGPRGNYNPLYDPGAGSAASYIDGSKLSGEISGKFFTGFIDDVVIPGLDLFDLSDFDGSWFTSGQPGWGTWPADGSDYTKQGFKSWNAGNA